MSWSLVSFSKESLLISTNRFTIYDLLSTNLFDKNLNIDYYLLVVVENIFCIIIKGFLNHY